MGDRRYADADGGLPPGVEPIAAHRDGIDEERVAALLSEVHIVPELLPREATMATKSAARPFLQDDGRNEFEGHETRRIYSVIEKTIACNPLVVGFVERPAG